MTHIFDADTAIDRIDETAWDTRLTDAWSIGKVPNGGYSSAAIVRALLERTQRPDPVSLTTHFYRPTIADHDATIETIEHRSGRTFANASALMTQDGKERTRLTGVLGDLTSSTDDDLLVAPVPSIPPPEDCPKREPGVQDLVMPLMEVLDVRLDPGQATRTSNDDPATIAGWIRFTDERPVDPLALTLFADAFPPSILSIDDKIGWVPTLELTIHVRRRPVDGWIQAAITTQDVGAKLLIEDTRLWDSSGTLVCQARQLAMRGQRQ